MTPDTLLRWYRQLVAARYDGSAKRGPGGPRIKQSITGLVVESFLFQHELDAERVSGGGWRLPLQLAPGDLGL